MMQGLTKTRELLLNVKRLGMAIFPALTEYVEFHPSEEASIKLKRLLSNATDPGPHPLEDIWLEVENIRPDLKRWRTISHWRAHELFLKLFSSRMKNPAIPSLNFSERSVQACT